MTPTPERPDFDPAYEIPATPPPDLPWSEVEEQLAASRNYWIASTRADGRPHSVPVWGVWLDGALIFSTGRTSAKGRNLARDPRVVAHLESGDDVVMLEGVVEEVREPDVLERWVDAYDAKYQFRPDTSEPANVTYRVVSERAYTWTEQGFQETAARWRFE